MPRIDCKRCKGCKERQVGCHAKCEYYIAFRKERDDQNALIYDEHRKLQILNHDRFKKRNSWDIFKGV